MVEIIDARKICGFENQFVLFDTNVWIYIYGNDPRPEKSIYSDFYKSVLEAGNSIIVNEQIISEFFNRFCRMEFDAQFGRGKQNLFKKLRKSNREFKEKVEVVRGICLDILCDCTYQQTSLTQDRLEHNLHDVIDGKLDLTDAALVGECVSGGFILVSHDGDFADSDIKLATANEKVIGALK
ncbi:PIN domain-containing protein [Terasakiella pusilla]|uniref:PIN domain-containing protein n=1 Tax=Terasakiella pusilla TaxID=64973 RepID=UPI003AA92542